MPLGGSKEHFSCFHTSCQTGLIILTGKSRWLLHSDMQASQIQWFFTLIPISKKRCQITPLSTFHLFRRNCLGEAFGTSFFLAIGVKMKTPLRLSYLYLLLFLFWINLGQRQNTCEIPWCNKSNLVKHTILEDLKKSDSDIEVLKPYKCSHCDSSFELEKILLQHLAASHLFCWKKKNVFVRIPKFLM